MYEALEGRKCRLSAVHSNERLIFNHWFLAGHGTCTASYLCVAPPSLVVTTKYISTPSSAVSRGCYHYPDSQQALSRGNSALALDPFWRSLTWFSRALRGRTLAKKSGGLHQRKILPERHSHVPAKVAQLRPRRRRSRGAATHSTGVC